MEKSTHTDAVIRADAKLAERVSRLEDRLDEMEHTRRLIEHQVALAAVAIGSPSTDEAADVKIAKGELNAIRFGGTLTAAGRDTVADNYYGCCECGWHGEAATGAEAEALCVSHVDEVHKEFVALYPDLSRVEVAA